MSVNTIIVDFDQVPYLSTALKILLPVEKLTEMNHTHSTFWSC